MTQNTRGKYKEFEGNLIEIGKLDKHTVIAHQCNCFCTMGAGIAPQIANTFPEAEEADNQTEKGNPYKLGTFSKGYNQKYNTTVYNIYGQFHWCKFKVPFTQINTDYQALIKAMDLVASDMVEKGYDTIYFPLIGCGLAGGDWDLVRPIIKRSFLIHGINVGIVHYKP